MKKSELLIVGLRIGSMVFCGLIFAIVSHELIRDYLDGKEIVTRSKRSLGSSSSISPPKLMICSKNAFKDSSASMFTKEEYMENTVNTTEQILLAVVMAKVDLLKTQVKPYDSKDILIVEDMFTAYNGHCSLIKFKGTMKPDDWIMLALNRQIESSVYIPTDDTGQIQMHFKSLNTDGTTIDIGQDAVLAVIDLYIEEFLDQVDSVCSKSVEYMKSECILSKKNSFGSKNGAFGFSVPKCNLPWELSLDKDLTDYMACKTDAEFKNKTFTLDSLIYLFSEEGTPQYRKCPERCHRKRTKVLRKQIIKRNSIEEFVRSSIFAISSDAMKSNFDLNSTTFVTIKYPSNGIVKTITKSYLVDGITLFSNIGGGLGLALGFSMYSVIDYIIEKSGSRIK